MRRFKKIVVLALTSAMLTAGIPVTCAPAAVIRAEAGETVSGTFLAGKSHTLRLSGIEAGDVEETSWKTNKDYVAKLTVKDETSAKVRLLEGGKATVTATVRFKDGTVEKFIYKLTAEDPSVLMEPEEVQLTAGDTAALSVTYRPFDTVLEFRTSNDDVAIIGDDGIVTAVAAGKARIIATVTYGKRKVRTSVKVSVTPRQDTAPAADEAGKGETVGDTVAAGMVY